MTKTYSNPDIQEIYKLMKEHEQAPSEADKKLIEKAFLFAQKVHAGQERVSGEPYFIHPFETAKNLARYGMDSKTIAAGLLHDTIEDGQVSEAEFKKEFDSEMFFLVNGVTKLGKLKYRGRERYVESLRKFFVALAQDFRILMIKSADRLHNLKTLQYIPEKKRYRIALESLEVYAPLVNRLGIGKLKGEIEDAAFPYVYPKEYKMVEEFLAQKAPAAQKYLEKVRNQLVEEFKEHKINYLKMDFRVKHKYSLYRKLLKYDMNIEKIYDIVALRVIMKTVEECYQVLGIIHSIWRPLPGRIKDYIALPKLNGYQSLHTTVFTGEGNIVEFQIRTLEMHGLAEYGIASHFLYKEQEYHSLKKIADKKYNWIEKFKELQKHIKEHDVYLESLRLDFFKDRIFVFTPGGDVIDLPEGACPIDFAYSVHTDIGDHIAAAKINGKISSLDSQLKNGDIVEIITKKNAHPSPKWLDYVKTTLAKKHIRSRLKK